MCHRNIYIDVPLLYTYTMINIHFNPVSTTFHRRGNTTIINVNSKYYESDINYQNSINQKLNTIYESKRNRAE